MKFELWYPVKPWNVSQDFYGNANTWYKDNGNLGHGGIDVVVPYDTPIYPAVSSPVTYEMNFDKPTDKYRAVFQIVDTDDFSYEIAYGHCNRRLGGDGCTNEPIATVGNTGTVYANGVEVTDAERDLPHKPGTHLHFQVRELIRRPSILSTPDHRGKQRMYIKSPDGKLFQRNGYYYEVADYWNGYNGLIDPKPFFNRYFAQDRKEVIGILQKIISILQQALKK